VIGKKTRGRETRERGEKDAFSIMNDAKIKKTLPFLLFLNPSPLSPLPSPCLPSVLLFSQFWLKAID
jgi:hypothetical protein